MENIKISINDIIIILKSKSYEDIFYHIIPSISYSDKELFPTEDSLFPNVKNMDENCQLIIIGQKLLKRQIDSIKNEILQKRVCDLNAIYFEYEDILDDNIIVSINYDNIFLTGKYKMDDIMFKLHGSNWIEINDIFK
tara:strand:+ start:668 stop:1081 length:414 start_codon:yes stop_codon:yes gene_type:complete